MRVQRLVWLATWITAAIAVPSTTMARPEGGRTLAKVAGAGVASPGRPARTPGEASRAVAPAQSHSVARAGAAKPAPPPEDAPTLAEVVRRIEQIVHDAQPARAARRSARPSRPAPPPQPARGVALTWAEPPAGLRGVQIAWPADIDPRRPPRRPLGQRLHWIDVHQQP